MKSSEYFETCFLLYMFTCHQRDDEEVHHQTKTKWYTNTNLKPAT